MVDQQNTQAILHRQASEIEHKSINRLSNTLEFKVWEVGISNQWGKRIYWINDMQLTSHLGKNNAYSIKLTTDGSRKAMKLLEENMRKYI